MARPRRTVGMLVVLALVLGAVGTRTFGADREGSTTLAFMISKSDMGLLYGKFEEECPQGFEMTAEDSYRASLTPAQLEWMVRPENAFEYNASKRDYLNGPGTNVCSHPKSFKDDPRRRSYRGVASKVAYGLSLDGTTDGRATPKTCAHQKFQGLNGEPIADNQLYRVSGCSKLNRGTERQTTQHLQPFLVELRGVDDLRNDADVDMGVYSIAADDVSLKAADGSEVAHQTFTITPNPRWRAQTKARIVDGVLISEPIPVMHLSRGLAQLSGNASYVPNAPGNSFIRAGEFEFRDVRVRVTLKPDGTFAGVMANYRPIDNLYLSQYAGGAGTANTANNDCAAEYNTLAQFADGYPDPVTGQCSHISAAENITGIPTFIVAPQGETLSAVRAGSRPASK